MPHAFITSAATDGRQLHRHAPALLASHQWAARPACRPELGGIPKPAARSRSAVGAYGTAAQRDPIPAAALVLDHGSHLGGRDPDRTEGGHAVHGRVDGSEVNRGAAVDFLFGEPISTWISLRSVFLQDTNHFTVLPHHSSPGWILT